MERGNIFRSTVENILNFWPSTGPSSGHPQICVYSNLPFSYKSLYVTNLKKILKNKFSKKSKEL